MRYLLLFHILLSVQVIKSQDYFHSTYDIHMDEFEEGRDIHILSDGYLVTGTGNNGEDNYTYIMKCNLNGSKLWVKEYTEFIGNTMRTTIEDSILFMPGELVLDDGTLEDNGYRIFQFNLEGELLDTRKYDLGSLTNPPIDSVAFYAPFGNIVYGDKIVMFGEVIEANYGTEPGIPLTRGLMMWLNKDLSLDTIIFIQPRYRTVDIWDANIDPDGFLTLLVDDDTNNNGEVEHFRRFEKFDSEGNKIFMSDPLELVMSRRVFLQSAVLPNGDMIMNYLDDELRSYYVVSIDKEGKHNWTHRMEPYFNIDERHVDEMQAAQDGHLIIAGEYEDITSDRQGTFISKHDYRTGELIWERVYQDWSISTRPNLPLNALLSSMKVDLEGNMIAVGQALAPSSSGGLERDIVLTKVDTDGCLTPNCGGFEQTVAGIPRYYHMFYSGAQWYHQDPQASGGVYRIFYQALSNREDSIFQQGRNDWELDPTVVSGAEAHINWFRITNEGRQMYLVDQDNGDLDLIYDFTLEVGDIFSTTYLQQDLEVIASDTILLLNGAKRRTWTLACTESPQNTITWIEGIGSHYGMLWPKNFCAGDYGDVRLTCYFVYERLHYVNPDIGGCFISSTDDEQYNSALSNITIFPNPTSSRLTISSPELGIHRIDILDVQGQTQSLHYDDVREIKYDLQGYVPGLYFFSVHTEKGQVVKKVVVE